MTDSGRVVKIERDTVIPTAGKRKVVRATTAVLFFAVVFALLGLMIFAVVMMIKPEPEPVTSHLALQTFEYERDQSPWTLDKPNAMGYALGDSCVVIVDASKEADPWLADIKSALATGMTRADSRAKVNVIYANHDGIDALYGSLQPIGGNSQSKLTSYQEPFVAKGAPALADAFHEAVEDKPEQIILITGRKGRDMDLQRIEEFLEIGGQTLHVVDLRDDVKLERLAQGTGGQWHFISSFTLEGWARE